MNKRYMDFVPSKAKKAVASKPKKETGAKTEVIVPKAVAPKVVVPKPKPVVKKPVERKVEPRKEDARLGVIEDLNTDYRETNVARSHFVEENEGVRAAKAKKVGLKEVAPEKPSGLSTKAKTDGIYETPKTPFINQDKVVKRPLSKNVYQKKVEVPKEEPKGPVTIITKPEKQAHVSIIVTIILTIILGAAAGTIAFLLLPK